MLGVFCSRPKLWLQSTLSLFHAHGSAAVNRLTGSPPVLRSVAVNGCSYIHKRHHSSTCRVGGCDLSVQGATASVWHAILPAGDGVLDPLRRRRTAFFHNHHDELMNKGEGSWNVAWDARPARWLHNPDSAWLLFGVCACLAAPVILDSSTPEVVLPEPIGCPVEQKLDELQVKNEVGIMDAGSENENSPEAFKVTGVLADGRCLFRAIAHVACLRKGEEAPDENRQRELADELRALVVEELLKRRKEAEWFIEGDFDAYVERIEKPFVWGGEPELLMASHVLKTPISVFMVDRSLGSLKNIANYGEEYNKNEPINVLFHGYGHYDILDILPESYQKMDILSEGDYQKMKA